MFRKLKIRNFLFLALTLLWMIIIFYYSSKNATLSTEDSYRAGLYIGHLFYPNFDNLDHVSQIAFAELIDHPVRKAAHASEYAILAMLLIGGLMPSEHKYQTPKAITSDLNIKSIKNCWILSTLYACTDEFHQLFVPGRAGMVTDIIIDSMGACVGIIIANLFFLLYILIFRSND